jgi:hypothetical protein
MGSVFGPVRFLLPVLPTSLVFVHIEHICGGIISEHKLTVHLVYFKLNVFVFLIYMFLIYFFYVESMPVMSLWSLSSSEYREAMLSS